MHFLPKRLFLVAAAPFAIAAVYGGSIAFAQSGEPTTTPDAVPSAQAEPAPATPDSATPDSTAPETAPGMKRRGGGKDCGTDGSGVAPAEGSGGSTAPAPESAPEETAEPSDDGTSTEV